jgi:gliding motility-associated-like protein
MDVDTSTFVCTGNSVQLHASGAATYRWTDMNRELSDTTIANPVATPNSSTRYTVTGYDAYQCFTDQAKVEVTVFPRPTVNAGQDIEMLTGDTRRLQPTSSNDVKEWKWSPGDYLSCANCATPTILPRKPMTYTVSVKNEYGCENSDTVHIKLLCSDAYIFIPNGFTPNNDQKNEVFYIKGKGVSIVKSMRIFNRWGALMFEKKNFYIDDRSSAWDGKYNGKLVPTGSYVYVTEMQCDGGDVFTRQGTVTVIY